MSELKVHQGYLENKNFEYFRDGTKIYELRINDEKRQQMNIGDLWVFKNEKMEEFKTLIVGKNVYSTFENAIDDIGFSNLLNVNSRDEAIRIYKGFNNGDYEKYAKKYGIVVFTLTRY